MVRLTFVASIPALLLYDPVLNDTGYILGAGADTRVQLGAFLEILTAIAGIATAVVLFPVVLFSIVKQSEAIALGYGSWPSKTERSCSGPPTARGSGTACCSAT